MSGGPGKRLRENGWKRTSHRLVMTPVSLLSDDDLEIFARHDHGAVAGTVHPHDQRVQVVVQLFLLGGLERRERLQYRAVIGLEHVEEMRRRAVAELEQPRFRSDRA